VFKPGCAVRVCLTQQQHNNDRSQVTCCTDSNTDAFAESDIEIGSCAFDTTAWSDDPIAVSTTASKIGTFVATCTLKNAASLCVSRWCGVRGGGARGWPGLLHPTHDSTTQSAT
jgi:hypothetical protein